MIKTLSELYLSFKIDAKNANVAPPLSTVLGNEGLKTLKFCEEFNKLTEDLPEYLNVTVFLKIDKVSRSWKIKLGGVDVSKLFQYISLVGIDKKRVAGGLKELKYFFINLKDLYLISYFKKNNIFINNIYNIIASLYSTGIKISI